MSAEELASLATELPKIVSYVSVISDITAADADAEPQVGPLHNVFRSDVVTNEPDQYTDALLREMPATDGRYMKVQKILKTDNT